MAGATGIDRSNANGRGLRQGRQKSAARAFGESTGDFIMMVRNWMQANPITIPSDMLVSDAKRLLSEHNLHALPVVDQGHLRGLVTRANMLRIGHFVMATQDPDEFGYFVNRLRVRDVMVRNPATVSDSDTMEEC